MGAKAVILPDAQLAGAALSAAHSAGALDNAFPDQTNESALQGFSVTMHTTSEAVQIRNKRSKGPKYTALA
jgi:hypothetical protein